MAPYDVQFLQEAMEDLEEIILYIAKDSRRAALQAHDKIITKVRELSVFPRRGRPVPDKKMADAGYRMLGILPYIAFYRIVGEHIFIYRVIHGATNYPLLYEKMVQKTPPA